MASLKQSFFAKVLPHSLVVWTLSPFEITGVKIPQHDRNPGIESPYSPYPYLHAFHDR